MMYVVDDFFPKDHPEGLAEWLEEHAADGLRLVAVFGSSFIFEHAEEVIPAVEE